ncbi:MAG: metallophosphoesterase [bacterium]
MSHPFRRPMSRRDFIRGVGAGAGALGVSSLFPHLTGCGPLGPLLYGNEMVGRVTGNGGAVQLVAGDGCEPSTRFRLLYDTLSRSNPEDYRYQSAVLSGFVDNDPITFQLTGLSASTRYFYRIGYEPLGQDWSYRDEYSFRTRRTAGQSFRFCVTADMHVYPYPFFVNERIRQRIFQNVLADAPDVLFTLGDDVFVAYQGPENYPYPPEKFSGTFRRARSILDAAGHSVFVLPVLGNHDGLYGFTAGSAEYASIRDLRFRYFPVPGATTFPQGGDPDGRYGAFTWGDALFVWLDILGFCAVDPYLYGAEHYILGTEQRSFLQGVLSQSAAPWKFVFAHHIFGGDDDGWAAYGRGNANDAHAYQQAEIQTLMLQYGARVFFYGHDHVFSHSKADGVSYLCAGNAGSGCPWVAELLENYPPYELFYTDADGGVPPGHVRADVNAVTGAVTLSYILASLEGDNGTVLATFTLSQP